MADFDALSHQYGVSVTAVQVLARAVRQGGGRMAQFSHPELGGMGQWSAGGMTQIGDMFDAGLRDKVAALCAALAEQAPGQDPEPPAASAHPSHDAQWWPAALGRPSASGSQNGLRYACFPDARRVAVEQSGVVTLYDSGAHRITGVSQAQGGGRTLTFASQLGIVRAEDLPMAG